MRRTITMLFALLSMTLSTHAQWTQLQGPDGGVALALAETTDGSIYAAQYAGGIFRSVTGGLSWELALTAPWTENTVLLAAADDGWLYAGGYNGLYRSPDGANWEQVALGSVPSAITFAANGDVLVGVNGGLRRSTDRGDSWTAMTPISGTTRQMKIAVLPARDAWVAGAYQAGIARSTDEGQTWERVDAGLPNTALFSLSAVDGAVVFAGLTNTTYFSTDAGTTWEHASGLDTLNTYAVHRVAPNRLLAETSRGLYASTDDGRSWTRSAAGAISALSSLKVLRSGSVLAAADGRIMLSMDRGSTWQPSSAGFRASNINLIGIPGGDVLLAGSSVNGLHVSTNRGREWEYVLGIAPPGTITDLLVTPSGHAYALSTEAGLLRSLGGGAQWTRHEIPFGTPLYDLASVGGPLIAADEDSLIYASTDQGETWLPHGALPAPEGGFGWIRLTADRRQPHIVYAGTDRGLFSSSDAGVSWEQQLVAGTNRPVWAMQQDSRGNLYLLSQFELYRRPDGAAEWESVFRRADSSPLQPAIAVNDEGAVYIASAMQVHGSTDGGASWETFPAPGEIRALAIDSDGFLLAGTRYHGLFRSDESTVNVDAAPPSPVSLYIDGIYPQPLHAGAETFVQIRQSAAGPLHLLLYDMLGRVVFVQALPSASAGIRETVLRPPSSLPRGAYHLVVAGSDQRAVQRVIIR